MTHDLMTGSRVHLRAVEPSDTDMLYRWENDTSIWKVSNTLAPFSRFQIAEFIANSKLDIFETRQLRLMIELRENFIQGPAIGSIDLFDFDPVHSRAGIGIMMTPPFREKGFAAEALEVFLHYLKVTLHLHQVYCTIAADNLKSIRLFENAGFIRCGIRKEWIRNVDGFSDEYLYQLIFNYE